MLGTASQAPTRHRNHNGYLLRWDGEGVLFDPGEGAQRQLLLAGAPSSAITRICVTHFHGDHCLGVPGIVQRLSLDRVAHPVVAHYPSSDRRYFDRLRHASAFVDMPDLREEPVAGPVDRLLEPNGGSARPTDRLLEPKGGSARPTDPMAPSTPSTPSTIPEPAAREGDPAVLIPTSGTTGRPKLVTQTHRAYVMAGEGFPYWMQLTTDDRLMTSLPLFHINAPAYSALGSVAAGAGVVLLPRFSASGFLDAARRDRVQRDRRDASRS